MALYESGEIEEFPYYIIKHSKLGHLCGYLGVPKDHPWYGQDGNEIRVHGGISWSGDHIPNLEPEPNIWWLGFDCGHYGDVIPYMMLSIDKDETFKDRAYVYNELL